MLVSRIASFYLKDIRATKELINRCEAVELNSISLHQLLELLRLCLDKYEAEERATIEAINKINNETYKELLTLRYIKGYTWQHIEDSMSYSHAQVHRLHQRALKELEL